MPPASSPARCERCAFAPRSRPRGFESVRGQQKSEPKGSLLCSDWRRAGDSARLRRAPASDASGILARSLRTLRVRSTLAPSRVRIRARATKKRAKGLASLFGLAESWGFRAPTARSGFGCLRHPRPLAANAARSLHARALAGSNPCAGNKKASQRARFSVQTGGELGIRTPDSLLGNTRLAGEHLRPLGQLSVTASES